MECIEAGALGAHTRVLVLVLASIEFAFGDKLLLQIQISYMAASRLFDDLRYPTTFEHCGPEEVLPYAMRGNTGSSLVRTLMGPR